MAFRLLKSEVKPLTQELAVTHRDMEPSPTERDLNAGRIRYLQTAAEKGRLIAFQWATAKLGDKVLRMNGQHSSNVLSALNGTFPKGLYVHIDQYEVDSPNDLAELFRQFDSRTSSRTPSDVSGAYQMLFPDLRPIAKPHAKIGAEAVDWYQHNIEGLPQLAGDERYTLFNREGLHPFLGWLNELFSIKTPELKRKEVVAAIYATYSRNPQVAAKFWDSVARGGVQYEDNAPATVLDAWLKAAKEGEIKEPLKPAQYYQGCIYAWNAFREEKSLKEIKANTSKAMLNPIE